MADRTDYYFRQKVTEAELDLAFELLEQADRDLAADIGVYGIISGAIPAPHAPVPDLTIDLTAPCRAYDHLGQRAFFGTDQTIDCSVDLTGIPTEVTVAGEEKWLGVFLRFDRLLSDPRTDGNSQQVYFRRDESFEVVVRQGAQAPIGASSKVPLQESELLICDVLRSHGQLQIQAGDIDSSRRQAFIFANGDSVEVTTGLWNILQPVLDNAQATFDEVDAELNDHFTGAARRHPATDIDYPAHGFIASTNVGDAIDELVDELSSASGGSPGASKVGADAAVGVPHSLAAANVDTHLSQLLGWLNGHVGAPAGAHDASAISALPHAHIGATNVQSQLQEVVSDLESTGATPGTSRVGNDDIGGAPYSLAADTLRAHLVALLGFLNSHAGGSDHDDRYFTEAEADARYYNVGETVGDADTVDGSHASDFATAGHDHDDRYLRRIYSTQELMDPADSTLITTLADQPDLVTVTYNYPDPGTGLPQATTYVRGSRTAELHYWITKLNLGGGDKDYEVRVNNQSTYQLWVNVAAYRRDA